ncbi:ATP-binding protein [Shimazuella kribbensis]|uniref:ATP-binding protein n=1 Tax=Shimazuella kribbensis TaxID=139808 RepID=UPI0003F88BC9|nr:ATP-binding protein [Shimazuella kribbensis]
MNRYYLFPQWRPKGSYYQLKRTPNASPSQQKVAWEGVLEYLSLKKWYRRFPFRFKEPWLSWELHATGKELYYYYWAPDKVHGYEIAQRLAIIDPALEVSIAEPPEALNFQQAHYGYKMQFEKNFCLPTGWDTASIEQALHEYLSKLKDNQRIICQFLIRPVYDYQITRKFTNALHSLERSNGIDSEEKNRLHGAIFQKQQQTKAEVVIRLLAFADTIEESKQILEPCAQILAVSDNAERNNLQWREWWRMIRPLFRYEFTHKLFPFRKQENALIMGSDELAKMIHPPSYTPSSKIPWLGGKRVAEPLDIRNQQRDDKGIRIGTMEKNLNVRTNQLSIRNLESHFAVFGSSKTGKTTTLVNVLVDYMKQRTDENRLGFTVLDIQGKLANQLLERIPRSQHHLVKIIRFKRGQYPFNYFDIDFATSDHQKARIVLEIFHRLGKGYWTPFVSDHLLYGAMALLKLGRATLFNLQLLIEDNEFCMRVIRQLNPAHPIEASIAKFFKRYLQDQQQSNWKEEFYMSSMITRLRELNMSGMSTTLNHYSNGIRWNEALNEGHFQIFDLSGLNAGDRPRMGASVVTLFQAAMLTREEKRAKGDYLPLHPLVLDDASIYLNEAFGDLEYFLHEAKKYRMPLWMGLPGITNYINQSVAESIFRNVETILSYRLANATDADFIHEHMHTVGLESQDFQMLDPFYGYLQMAINNVGQRTYAFTNRGYLPSDALLNQAEIDELEMAYLGEISKREQNWEMAPWKSSSEKEERMEQIEAGSDEIDEYLRILYGDSLGTNYLKPF